MTGCNILITTIIIILGAIALIVLVIALALRSRDRKAKDTESSIRIPVIIHHTVRHNDKLVTKYNELVSWNGTRDKVYLVLSAQMRRDRTKIYDRLSINIDRYETDEELVDAIGQEYLEKIATDGDLETILGFMD